MKVVDLVNKTFPQIPFEPFEHAKPGTIMEISAEEANNSLNWQGSGHFNIHSRVQKKILASSSVPVSYWSIILCFGLVGLFILVRNRRRVKKEI